MMSREKIWKELLKRKMLGLKLSLPMEIRVSKEKFLVGLLTILRFWIMGVMVAGF